MVLLMKALFMLLVSACVASVALADASLGLNPGSARHRYRRATDTASLQDGATFEYIVVGAGAGGCAAAARLALAGRRVLLVEAGGDAGLLSKIPAGAQTLMGSRIDYQYETITNNISCLSFKHRSCRFSRGKALGGSTTMNYMIHTRGSPQDFNEFDIPGWTWDDMMPYFLRYEGLQDLAKLPKTSIPYHNTTGPMKMEFFSDSGNPWHSRLITGFEAINIPFNDDVNAASQIGVTQTIGYVYDNERMSSARGYLEMEDVRKRLKVAKFTKCTGLIIEDGNVVKGITVTQGLLKTKLKLYATKEVILSAGTIETPHILMLSGIGPAEHLKEFNIPVMADLPVGNNMTDHALPLVMMKVDEDASFTEFLAHIRQKAKDITDLLFYGGGPLTSNGLTDVTTFVNSECYDFEKRRLVNDTVECAVPTTQFIHSYIGKGVIWLARPAFQRSTNLNDAVTAQLAKVSFGHGLIVFSPLLLKSLSQGTVRLASADPDEPPAIFPNYLADARDVDEMVRAITIIEHIQDTPLFKMHNAAIVHLKLPGCPEYEAGHAQYWRCYIRQMTQSCFHAAGTAALGRALDARLRVRGVRRLRVADLAALPRPPRANTAAAALAVGERVAQFILHPDDADDEV